MRMALDFTPHKKATNGRLQVTTYGAFALSVVRVQL